MTGTAVIIEPRCRAALPFVVNNIAANIPMTWNILILHGFNNKIFINELIQSSPHRMRIFAKELPSANFDNYTVNALMATSAFYDLIPTENILNFHTDSMIFEENAHLFEQFIKYDYVGAPWVDGTLGNGGFSIRKKSVQLKALELNIYDPNQNEDTFFSKHSPYKPDWESAKTFAIETVFHERSLACHNPWVHIPHDILFKAYPVLKELHSLQFNLPAEKPPQTLAHELFEIDGKVLGEHISTAIALFARSCCNCVANVGAASVGFGMIQGDGGSFQIKEADSQFNLAFNKLTFVKDMMIPDLVVNMFSSEEKPELLAWVHAKKYILLLFDTRYLHQSVQECISLISAHQEWSTSQCMVSHNKPYGLIALIKK